MTLTTEETKKLIEATDGQPLKDVIDLACETLTLKIVLLLKTEWRGMVANKEAQPTGSVERANLVGQINALKHFSVKLAEHE